MTGVLRVPKLEGPAALLPEGESCFCCRARMARVRKGDILRAIAGAESGPIRSRLLLFSGFGRGGRGFSRHVSSSAGADWGSGPMTVDVPSRVPRTVRSDKSSPSRGTNESGESGGYSTMESASLASAALLDGCSFAGGAVDLSGFAELGRSVSDIASVSVYLHWFLIILVAAYLRGVQSVPHCALC